MADLKDLMKLRVVDLKERLIALGKSPKGKKAELAQQLFEALGEPAANSNIGMNMGSPPVIIREQQPQLIIMKQGYGQEQFMVGANIQNDPGLNPMSSPPPTSLLQTALNQTDNSHHFYQQSIGQFQQQIPNQQPIYEPPNQFNQPQFEPQYTQQHYGHVTRQVFSPTHEPPQQYPPAQFQIGVPQQELPFQRPEFVMQQQIQQQQIQQQQIQQQQIQQQFQQALSPEQSRFQNEAPYQPQYQQRTQEQMMFSVAPTSTLSRTQSVEPQLHASGLEMTESNIRRQSIESMKRENNENVIEARINVIGAPINQQMRTQEFVDVTQGNDNEELINFDDVGLGVDPAAENQFIQQQFDSYEGVQQVQNHFNIPDASQPYQAPQMNLQQQQIRSIQEQNRFEQPPVQQKIENSQNINLIQEQYDVEKSTKNIISNEYEEKQDKITEENIKQENYTDIQNKTDDIQADNSMNLHEKSKISIENNQSLSYQRDVVEQKQPEVNNKTNYLEQVQAKQDKIKQNKDKQENQIQETIMNGGGPEKPKEKLTKNQKRKQRKKKRAQQRKQKQEKENDVIEDDDRMDIEDEEEEQIEIEYVPEQIAKDPIYFQYLKVFDKFRTGESKKDEVEIVVDPVKKMLERKKPVELELKDEDDKKDGEPKLSKRKMKQLTRMSVADLKQRVSHPELVEMHDVTAKDPLLLLYLKSTRNTVPVPRHWCYKRKYLQGKRGFEKPPFKLPEFIRKTGIMEMRQALQEKEDSKSLKAKMREKIRPKMGKIDIDYQKLHDAFFKWQTKPKMTIHGDLYYEGKEFETRLKEKKPGELSTELRAALGMPTGPNAHKCPPPWLIAMQRYGPPPSYPNLKIPGLNAPIPEGCSFGYHAGGWGKPPVDEYGRPLYGDVFGLSSSTETMLPEEEVDRTLWGELESESEEEEEEEEEEAEPSTAPKPAAPSKDLDESGFVTPAEGLITPSGLASIPAGMETPDLIELRKRKQIEAEMERGDNPALFTVLPEKKVDKFGKEMMASTHTYDIQTATLRKSQGIEVALDPSELEQGALDPASMTAKYEQTMKEQSSHLAKEDLSDMVAEHAARQKRKKQQDSNKSSKKYQFKF